MVLQHTKNNHNKMQHYHNKTQQAVFGLQPKIARFFSFDFCESVRFSSVGGVVHHSFITCSSDRSEAVRGIARPFIVRS